MNTPFALFAEDLVIYDSIANTSEVFIAQMYAGVNPALRKMLDEENAKKINSLEQADTDFQRNYGGIK